MERENSYDIIRGFAIILVIVDHCGVPLLPVLDYLEVPAFFFVSGMLLSPKATIARFVWGKAKRLIPPYIIYSVAFVALCWWTLDVRWNISTMVLSIARPFNYPLWFLKALFWGLVIVRCMIAIRLFNGLAASVASVVVMAAVSTVYAVSAPMPDWLLMSGFPQGIVAAPLIAIGYVVKQGRGLLSMEWSPRLEYWQKMLLLGLGLLVVAMLSVRGNIHMHNADLGAEPALFYPYAALVFAAFMALAKSLGRMPLLQWCGRQSLELFGIHAIPIQIVRYLLI